MRHQFWIVIAVFYLGSVCVPAGLALDWDPITEAEKSLKTNPIDPGAGAIVLFKRGNIFVEERTSLFWQTRIQTYTRIKIFNDAGKEEANISFEAPKHVRLAKVEGRTILPSGQIVPLDASQVFRGRSYESGKRFAILKTSFSFPAVEPGAIVEFQTEEYVDSFWFPPWIFDHYGLATLRSTLKVVVGRRLALAQFPVETTRAKIKAHEQRTALGWQANYEVENLFPIRDEPYALPFRDQAVMVLFSPYEILFSDQTYPILQKWDDVAKLMAEWHQDFNKKSKEAKEKAKQLVGKISEERKKAEANYHFLQQNVASSELTGISLSRTADEVLSAKRGDPDEINALFVTMLREVKVEADVVFIAARNWQTLYGKFPNLSQFSRIVTRLNFKDGPVLADPADPAAPFGELPWFEQGVVGLAVKGDKAREAIILVRALEENTSNIQLSSSLQPDWKVESEIEMNIKGARAIEFRRDFLEEAPEKLEQRLVDFLDLGLPEAEVADVNHPNFRDSSQAFVLKARLRHELVDEGGPGQRLLNPWVAERYTTPLFQATERHSAVRFDYPEKRVSTSTWRLPPGVKVQQLPKEVHLNTDLGEFSHACTQQADTVTCTRARSLKKLVLQDAKEYLQAKQFFEEMARHDQEVIVLQGE